MSFTAIFKCKRTADIVKDVRDVRGVCPPPLHPGHIQIPQEFDRALFMSCTAKFKYKTPGDIVRDVRDVK